MGNKTKDYSNYLEKAENYYLKDDFKKAIAFYEKALKRFYEQKKEGSIPQSESEYEYELQHKIAATENLLQDNLNLSYINLENFKGFGDEKSFNIKPLTFLYGTNSAGKSSIFKSLLLLKQSLEETKGKSLNLIPNGTYVQLGNYNEFINNHNVEKSFRIKLGLSNTNALEIFFQNSQPNIYKINLYDANELLLTIKYKKTQFSKRERRKCDYYEISYLNKNHRLVTYYFCKDYQDAIKEMAMKELSDCIFTIDDFIIRNIKYDSHCPPHFDAFIRPFFNNLRTLLLNFSVILQKIYYIGPLREKPERYYISDGNYSDYVGQNGENTSAVLYSNEEILNSTNKWVKKLTNYSLKVSNITKTTKETGKQDIYSVRLIDKKTEANVNITDVGFGISQILPIIVQSFSAKSGTILIEEPEIHIHPKLQAELGSLFAEACKENTFIIETHSENLLLRIRKLIRKKKLRKEDVSIIYIDKSCTGSECIPIGLNDEGDFLDSWPHGFFEESYEELF